MPKRFHSDQQRLGWGRAARREFLRREAGVHHARRFGFGRSPEPIRFVQDHLGLGAFQIVVKPALESGRAWKAKCGMGPFPELGADPFPRRRDNDRFRSRQVVAAALGVHLELPDAFDFLESELDADRKIPVHREEVDDAAAAGEVSRPAHRVLVAVARCRELRRNLRGGCVHPLPDADARLTK